MIVVIDNYDSFTYNLVQYLGELGADPWVFRNDRVTLGELESMQTRILLKRYIDPLLARGADTLILGCTHYPFLAPMIAEIAGSDIALVDTGAAVASHLQRRIQSELPARTTGEASVQFFTSGDAAHASRIMSVLWGDDVEVKPLPQEDL